MRLRSTFGYLVGLHVFLIISVISCNEDDGLSNLYPYPNTTPSPIYVPKEPTGFCPAHKKAAGWKWAKNACRPSCEMAAELVGYGGYGRDQIEGTPDDPYVYVKDKDIKSCEKLVHFNHTDWREFYFFHEDENKAISSMETYEVAKDKGVCCVRGTSDNPDLRCPPERKAPHWQWMKNACRPSCGHAALYVGYEGHGEDNKPGTRDDKVALVAGFDSCEEVRRFGHSWKSFSFMDYDIEVSGHDSWEVAQIDGALCCVRGEPDLDPPPFPPEYMCPSDKTEPDWKWVESACRPTCKVAAGLAEHGDYGEDQIKDTADDPFAYVDNEESCEDLIHLGQDNWEDFSFKYRNEDRESTGVLEVTENGGVCCIRDTSE